jgi:hypothetical protein
MNWSDQKKIDYPEGTIVKAYGKLWKRVIPGKKRKRKSKTDINGNEDKN